MRKLEQIYEDKNLSHRAKTVYIYLRDRADREGKSWPALQTIAKDLALSKSTVKRAISDLKAAGYLETEQRWRRNGGKSSLLFKLLK
ncbi:helix-turn-helix domain-containing protein [Anaerotruncus sp. AF02-27]|uniref:helix-turn-helix domain-containing protein n=1 Tax=Anaerotruncus sp. AF02-27 TaxID=2292191 RepID=UPI000E47EA4B|nr:helix-turn-helix domain-containing protein [Anaerotruncus sp. AF02-27]RGX56780.1 helix-turn-helix domain-containing protein [Anaerotruncus sp. AF02-27]